MTPSPIHMLTPEKFCKYLRVQFALVSMQN